MCKIWTTPPSLFTAYFPSLLQTSNDRMSILHAKRTNKFKYPNKRIHCIFLSKFQFYKWLMDRQYNSTSDFKFKVLHKGIPLKLVSQKAPRVWNFIDQQDTDHFQHTNDSFIKIKKIRYACGYCKTFWSESGNITKKSLVLSCIFVSSKVHLIS